MLTKELTQELFARLTNLYSNCIRLGLNSIAALLRMQLIGSTRQLPKNFFLNATPRLHLQLRQLSKATCSHAGQKAQTARDEQHSKDQNKVNEVHCSNSKFNNTYKSKKLDKERSSKQV
jgi:hypothetical protein